MDTIRLKFRYDWNTIAQEYRELYFSEEIPQRKAGKITPTNSSRPVYTNNTWRKEQQKQGIYTPKYWLEMDFVDPHTTYFVIELSLPKLLFGTSVIEIKTEHRDLIIKKIQEFCKSIGIRLFGRQIFGTVPMAVAFGKNTDITDVATCWQAITALSLLDDRFRSECRILKFEKGGSELYFNSKSSTFKVYDKLREVANNAITPEEHKIVEASKSPVQKQTWIVETLRTELTLKDSSAIRKRLKPYIQGEPTFGSMFRDEIWEELLKNEVERIFNHPLVDFVFLSTLQANILEKLLDKYVKHHLTKLRIKDAIEKIQRLGGTKALKRYYTETYKSRQTYYNHQKVLNTLIKNIEISELEKLTASRFHVFYLRQFGIENSLQNKLF